MTDDVVFMAQFVELPEMLAWVRTHLQSLTISKTDKRKIELAVEEALVNVIRYAYKSSQGRVSISYLLIPGTEVVFTIQDEGIPFNPLEKIQSSIEQRNLPLDEREVGGLGILFMFEIMDEVIYDRENGRNILILKKKF